MRIKKMTLLILSTFVFFAKDVFACGEIDELKSDVGTVTVVDPSNYLVTIPEGTKEVTLSGTTRYSWVEGYAPRKVSTSERAELKVDGNACGYGIYTYFVKFKELSNVIAENETPPADPTTSPSTNPPETGSPEAGGAPTGTGNLILKQLEVVSQEIDFDPYKYEYELEVDLSVTSLNITAIPSDETVTVDISSNRFNLKEGENLISITLRDTSENTNVYNIKVNRLEPKSDNNYLASLTVAGYQLNFDPSVTFYTLETGKVSSLNITAITESELAKYEILGNSGLQDGSTVIVRVTAEDGSARDYLLNIKRVFNIMDYWIYIVIILLLLLFLLLLMISKQKKNKKKMGPNSIEGQKNTAGVIQEIAPQNSVQPEVKTDAPTASASPSTPGVLKIIEPTDVQDTPNTQQTGIADDDPTEIFQL
ncbi:MAG TPA: hypothetical protein DCY94_03575 [Firmicutes bacterium]|nr:hypothetical protein [Bacillota bacterium]